MELYHQPKSALRTGVQADKQQHGYLNQQVQQLNDALSVGVFYHSHPLFT